MNIIIYYRCRDSTEWTQRQLSDKEYFDLDPDETPEFDSVPWKNHACDYLSLSIDRLAQTKIIIDDDRNEQNVTIVETFWNEGKGRLIERSDEGKKSSHRELILFDKVGERKTEILRLINTSGIFDLIHHSLIERNVDGSENYIPYLTSP